MNKEYLTYDMKKTIFAILTALLLVGCYYTNDEPEPIGIIIEDYTGNTPLGSCNKKVIHLPKGYKFTGFSKEAGLYSWAMTEMDSGYIPKKSIVYTHNEGNDQTHVIEVIESW